MRCKKPPVLVPACALAAGLLMSCDASANEQSEQPICHADRAETPAVSKNLPVLARTTLSDGHKLPAAAHVASELPSETKAVGRDDRNSGISPRPDPVVTGGGPPMTIYWFFGGRP